MTYSGPRTLTGPVESTPVYNSLVDIFGERVVNLIFQKVSYVYCVDSTGPGNVRNSKTAYFELLGYPQLTTRDTFLAVILCVTWSWDALYEIFWNNSLN